VERSTTRDVESTRPSVMPGGDAGPARVASPVFRASASGGRLRSLVLFAAFVVGYVALDRLSYLHPVQQFNITPWNPQPALAIALVMTLGQRWLPAVFVAAWLAERLIRGELLTLQASLLAAAVLTLGYAAIAQALTGPLRVSYGMNSRGDVLRLAAVAVVGSLVTGALYVAALLASGTGPSSAPLVAIVGFWIGDAIGILVTLPLLLMLMDPERRRQLRSLATRAETLLQCLVIVVLIAVVFGSGGPDQFKFLYLLFLPIVWVAARSGTAGVAVAVVVAQTAVIVAVNLSGYQALTVFELQALLLALTFTAFFVGVTVDERRRATEELGRTLSLAVAGEMGAAIAHELNQPLLAVIAYAKAGRLVANEGDPDRLAETLDKLVDEAKRAADVVRRLRELFRVGSARRVKADVRVPIRRTLEALRKRALPQGVELALIDRGEVPEVMHDPVQIEVVVSNLVHNALDAMASAKRAGGVAVDIAVARDALTVSVVDDGPGIAAADAERWFEPLRTSKAAGMGMGLTISRAIVEAHGGRIWVEPGPRGVVRFTLPA
jgi:signal transduction histidine kinase